MVSSCVGLLRAWCLRFTVQGLKVWGHTVEAFINENRV